MKLPDLLLRLDDLYSRYLDVRLAALTGGNIIRSARVEDRLVVTLACEDALRGKMRTRAELRDELERCLCSEAKVEAATDTPFPNPEKAAAGLLDLEAKVRDALEHALGLADGRPLVDLIKDLAKQRDDIMAECHLRTVSGDGVKLRHDSAYLYSGRWARVCKMLRIDPEQEAPEALRMLRAAERSLTSEATVKLDLVPGKDVSDAQVVAALSTPLERRIDPKAWAEQILASEDRRDEELRAAARELASIDPTNVLLDQPGLMPTHELKLARLRHALAQAARETAGSRTACANRWLSIAATLGIDPGKNPPDDIAGFIDNGGKEALTQQIVREQWKGKGLAQVLFELMIPRRTEPAR